MSGTSRCLEFTLSKTNGNLSETRSSCGVLLCKTSSLGQADGKQRIITSMSLYKAVSQARQTNSDSDESWGLRRLATVSASKPNLEHVSDGMKITGSLRNGQASLRVLLSKQADCFREYSCEINEVDSEGKERIISSRLVQQSSQKNDIELLNGLTPSLFMRLFSLVQRLEVKLETTENYLRDKLNSVEDKTLDLQKEITDKIHSLENSLQSKLCQLETKLAIIDGDAIQQRVLNTIETRIDEHFKTVLNATEKADDTLNKTATLLTSLSSENTAFHKNIMTNYMNLFNNVSAGMDEVFFQNRNLTQTIENSLLVFREDFSSSLNMMESATNHSVNTSLDSLQTMEAVLNATQNFFSLAAFQSKINSSSSDELKSSSIGFYNPEVCQKNTPVLLQPASTPYPVIYRSNILGLMTPILCDTLTDNGGWIVIQRRSTGDVDFYRDWLSYKKGFGTFNTDFWLGLENIHAITRSGTFELRVDLRYRGQSKFANYGSFSLAGEDNNYTLRIGSYSGTAGDALKIHDGMQFTTYDRDNDKGNVNCASYYTGAWWYNSCHHSNLNGKWQAGNYKGPRWSRFTSENPASFTEMKIRRLGL
ncbi:fibrinogen-related protein 3.1 [Elysia marginata]|uniref:Fibrinogen-related protein 3.1 n=1 Tax=Elysia marginata TaxID=1093978 RepID=A0AAV4IJT7_9GAST|nr:fibrinogen-related protein 3.1 [Elysia marginata]